MDLSSPPPACTAAHNKGGITAQKGSVSPEIRPKYAADPASTGLLAPPGTSPSPGAHSPIPSTAPQPAPGAPPCPAWPTTASNSDPPNLPPSPPPCPAEPPPEAEQFPVVRGAPEMSPGLRAAPDQRCRCPGLSPRVPRSSPSLLFGCLPPSPPTASASSGSPSPACSEISGGDEPLAAHTGAGIVSQRASRPAVPSRAVPCHAHRRAEGPGGAVPGAVPDAGALLPVSRRRGRGRGTEPLPALSPPAPSPFIAGPQQRLALGVEPAPSRSLLCVEPTSNPKPSPLLSARSSLCLIARNPLDPTAPAPAATLPLSGTGCNYPLGN